jgi:hypothetical protein
MKKLILLFCVFITLSIYSQTSSLIISNGFGSGTYASGDSVYVLANPTPTNFVFNKWTSNAAMVDTFCVANKLKNITGSVTLTPQYLSAPIWTHNSEVINGSNVYHYFPTVAANLKGLILFFHGSNGSGGAWFTKVENRTFLNYAAANGYAVIATESIDRITGGTQPWQWSNNGTVASNPDITNIDNILDTLKNRGKITIATKLFGVGFSQGSGFTSIIAGLKNYSANSLGATPGVNSAILSTFSPTYWMSLRRDSVGDPQRLSKCISNYSVLVGRGIDAQLNIQEQFPITPNRFWRIPGIDSAMSFDIYNRLLINGYLNAKKFINFNPVAITSWKSVMLPTYSAFINEIEDQVIVCYTEHTFHSDQMYDIIKFFNRYANNVVGLTENKNYLNTVSAYPNPFTDKINLENLLGDETFTLTNSLGQLIYEGKNISERDFSDLDVGLYFLRIFAIEKNSHPIKLTKTTNN